MIYRFLRNFRFYRRRVGGTWRLLQHQFTRRSKWTNFPYYGEFNKVLIVETYDSKGNLIMDCYQ